MELFGFTAWQWLVLVQHELLLFTGIFFLIGALDDRAVDLVWLWLRLTGRGRDGHLPPGIETDPALAGPAAVFIPAWDEAAVIGATISHMLTAWPHEQLRIYLGCYANDLATLEAAVAAAREDPRLCIVVHERAGPSTKADCLNRLYRALSLDETRQGSRFRMIVLHDAEDMVDPAALAVLDRAISAADLVQLPVVPLPHEDSRWIGSHYCEEFAEQHGKMLVVRDALGVGVPLAGVGCAIARDALDALPRLRGADGPFAADCLTEDYELGLVIAAMGGRSRFLRVRAPDGRLIATRAYFPGQLDAAVRQKTRWLHGIAFQGWDRLGWRANLSDIWMRLHDRRGPFMALVLASAYLLLLLSGIAWGLALFGIAGRPPVNPLLKAVLAANLASLLWRVAMRFGFTAREHGLAEGLFAIARIPVTNIVAIMAGRRAIVAYLRSLRGQPLRWDKTEHRHHPAAALASRAVPDQAAPA